MSPKSSISALHAQTPTLPNSCYRCCGWGLGDCLHDPRGIRGPAALLSPSEGNSRYDQKPFGRPPTLLSQLGRARDILAQNRSKSPSVQRSNSALHHTRLHRVSSAPSLRIKGSREEVWHSKVDPYPSTNPDLDFLKVPTNSPPKNPPGKV